MLTKICVNTHLLSSILQVHIVSDCSDSARGLSLKGFPFSEANKGFYDGCVMFHMEVYLESSTGGLATVEPVTSTTIVLLKYRKEENYM